MGSLNCLSVGSVLLIGYLSKIIEGTITIAFGVIAWFFLPNFPDQNGFLNEAQTAYVLERVEKDRGDSVPDAISREKFFAHILDWKLWAISALKMPTEFQLTLTIRLNAGVMYMCATIPAYAIRFVHPIAHRVNLMAPKKPFSYDNLEWNGVEHISFSASGKV